MRTRKPISTISYNSDAFLKLKLEELRKAKIISSWFYVSHLREEDEKKDHKHVFIIPAKQLFTDDLIDEFIEPVPGSDKPLKCIPFQNSKFDDWYLYSIHDTDYLLRKGQSRHYHYCIDDVVCSDADELEFLVNEIDFTAQTSMASISAAIEQGMTWIQFVRRGGVPVALFKQYDAAWQALSEDRVHRNGRVTHSPFEVDPVSGEVIDSYSDSLD